MSETRAAGLDVFYPIVPDATWVARIVPLGVRTLQLRVKDASAADVRRQIGESLAVARRPRLPAHRQRLLARGDRRRRRLRAPRPGGSRRRRRGGDQGSGHAPRHFHAQRGRARQRRSPSSPTTSRWARSTKRNSKRCGGRRRGWRASAPGGRVSAGCRLSPSAASRRSAPTGVVAAGADSIAVITDFVTAQDPDKRVEFWLEWALARRRARN